MFIIKFKPVLLSQRSKQETYFRVVIPIQASKNEQHLNWVDLKQSSPRDYMNILDAYQDYLDLILANIDFFFETTLRQLKKELHHKLRTLLDIETINKQEKNRHSQSSCITKQISAVVYSFFDLEEEEEVYPNVNWVLVHKQLTYLRLVVEKELNSLMPVQSLRHRKTSTLKTQSEPQVEG